MKNLKKLAASIFILNMVSHAQAAWLKTYTAKEAQVPYCEGDQCTIYNNGDYYEVFSLLNSPISSFIPLSSGGMIVNVRDINEDDFINSSMKMDIYIRLDNDGNVVWSKKFVGDVLVSVTKDGIVSLSAYDPETDKWSYTSAKFDFETGNITDIADIAGRTFNTVYGNGNQLSRYENNIFLGRIGSGFGFVKLDDKNNVVLTRKYDFNGFTRTVSDGYLLRGTYYSDQNTNVIAKLNENGDVIAGSAKKYAKTISSKVLSDSSVLLYEISQYGFKAFKLDSDLRVVWSKNYSDVVPSAKHSIIEANDGALVFYTERTYQGNVKRPFIFRVNKNTGQVISQGEIATANTNIRFTLNNLNGDYNFIGGTQLSADFDANSFVSVDKEFKTNYGGMILGGALERIDFFINSPSQAGYLLQGTTESWGNGESAVMAGRLDKKVSIEGCPALAPVDMQVIKTNMLVENLPSPLTDIQLNDLGAFDVTVSTTTTEPEKFPLQTITAVDYPLVTKTICETKDSEPVATISLSATQLDFGSVSLGASATAQLNVKNTGNAPLAINGISGLAKPFSKNGDTCSNKTLGAGESCRVDYQFTPVAEGVATAALVVNSSDPENRQAGFTLSGTGTKAPTDLQVNALSTNVVGFGEAVTLSGKGFGSTGSIWVNHKKAPVSRWSDNAVVFSLPKSLKAGRYPVTLVKSDKTVVDISDITLSVPKLTAISETSGVVTLSGLHFGSGKPEPKVFFSSGKTKKAIKALPGYSDTAIAVNLPKNLALGTYQVTVGNPVGISRETLSFSVQ